MKTYGYFSDNKKSHIHKYNVDNWFTNYRAISLLPSIAKIYSIRHLHIYKTQNVINNSQYDFKTELYLKRTMIGYHLA